MLIVVAMAAIGGAISANGCGRLARNKAQDAVNAILPDYLGPARRYTTKVDAEPGAILRGHLKHVHIEGDSVQIAPDLLADKLTLDLREVSVDTKRRKLQNIESVRFTVTLGEATLNQYVRKLRPTIGDLRATLGDGELSVRARPAVWGFPTVPVAVSGTLAPTSSGNRLNFEPSGARVSIVPIARPLIAWLLRTLNPAVDLTGMRVPVQVDRVEIRTNGLSLSGIVRPEDLLRLQEQARQ